MNSNLRKYHEANGMTQSELAAAVDITRQSINAIERGRYNPSLELALKLAEEFDCAVEDCFSLE
jgi:putative transcriptional regulator